MKAKKMMERILSVILALVMVIGASPAVYAQEAFEALSSAEKLSFEKVEGIDADLRLNQKKDDLNEGDLEPEYDADEIVRVSIFLNDAAAIDLYSAENIAENSAAQAYREKLQQKQTNVINLIERSVLDGEELDVVWNLTLAANVISANVPYGMIEEIKAVKGVKNVELEEQYAPLGTSDGTSDPMMSTSSDMIGSTAAWASGYTGAGSRIAIIDTGLDLNHQSFDNDAYLYALAQIAAEKGMTADDYIASLDLLDKSEIDSVMQNLNIYPYVKYSEGTTGGAYYISEKVPFAINYVDRDYSPTHDYDAYGSHGSHVAGIAAANRFIEKNGEFVNALESVKMQGVAPDAQLVVMKVFGKSGGAYDSDYMVAIEDAIMLNCDTINLSLGADRGFTRSSAYQDILDKIAENDVIVAVSAGNAGMYADYNASGTGYMYAEDVDLSMIASPSAATNSLSVGSVENIGMTNYYIKSGEKLIFYEAPGTVDEPIKELTAIAGDVNFIFIDGIGTAEEIAAVVEKEGGAIAENTVLLCSRGTINFAEKANNAIANGFIGTIVYNNTEGTILMNMSGYLYDAPAVSITLADALTIKANATAADGYYKGTLYISDQVGNSKVTDDYTISSFSSWGVSGALEMKPEIVAPGGNIYSVNGMDPSGTAYENMSGTSMASPQIAGMSALVMQYIKETGLDVKTGLSSRKLATALLMGTAEPLKDHGSYVSVLQQGAGLANVGDAIASGVYIVMDENATSGADDGKVKVELGDDPDRNGVYSFSFKVNSIRDEDAIFSLNSDFFTQGAFMYGNDIYTDTATTALNANVSYALDSAYINASESFDCDLNNDGVTDEKDAQIILEYAAGNIDTISDDADVNEDGKISTYDAHLLLASIGSEYFVLKAGESVDVTVNVELTDDAKEFLNSVFENGTFVQGFVYVNPLVTEEGAEEAAHSIPVVGFYGNWSDASMYERANYEEYLYYQYNGGNMKFPYSGGLNYLTLYDEKDNEYYFVGNPYLVEDEFPADKVAIAPEHEVGDLVFSLIRNAASTMYYVKDGNGNIIKSEAAPQMNSAYFYLNANEWVYVNSVGIQIWKTPEELGDFAEGDQFTVGFMSVPEYYETDGELSTQDMLDLHDSGKIGDGAYHEYSFVVDGTEPEVLSVEKNADGDLIVKAKDNRHIAAVAAMSSSGGTTYNIVGADQDEIGETVEVVIDMEGALVNRDCMVAVCDYAGNETYYKIRYNDGFEATSGQMFAFTNEKTRGAANSWMLVEPDELYYYYIDESVDVQDIRMGGTLDMAEMDCNIIAAEYVNGYVYMITENSELIVSAQTEWETNYLAKIDRQYDMIRDLAFNTKNGKLYALAQDNIVYSIDLSSGELTKEFTVAPALAKTSMTEDNKELLAMAIDDEGNFYAVNNGASNYKNTYLYKWSENDIVEGKVTDLIPVNNTKDGYLGDYIYNNEIDNNGKAVMQSMAWDHDNDTLYYAAALETVSPYNILYTVDTETGKAAVTGAEANVTETYDWSRGILNCAVSGLYIVPGESGSTDWVNEAIDLTLYDESVTLLKGAKYTLTWDVLPWNLNDKEVTWTVMDETVASVNASGVVTALKEGKTVVTATTSAAPNISKSCEIVVEDIKDVQLNAMIYNTESSVEWINFNLLDSENWTGSFVEPSKYFIAGGFLDETLYLHDGDHMYGVNANTFEVTDYGYLDPTWHWSDAAPAPLTEDGYFDRIVGIISDGRSLGVMNVPTGKGYELSHYSLTAEDPMAMIAYVGTVKHTDAYDTYNAHKYYILTESGKLYEDIIWGFYDSDVGSVMYTDEMTYVGDTGLRLRGAGTPDGQKNGSMYYDAENNYLIVAAYHGGDSSVLYAFHPEVCAPVQVGTFGDDIWPVTTLYYYDQITDLTVKVKPVINSIYADEKVQLTASVYPAHLYPGNKVTWTSSDPTVATVDENGLVTALKAGTVTITATSVDENENNESAKAEAVVNVKPLAAIDEEFHAYVETTNGGKWIAINGNDLSISSFETSDASYTGAGVVDGKVYATDDTYFYVIDPKNGYTVSQGDDYTDGDSAEFMYMLDAAAAPKETVTLPNFYTNGEYTGSDVEIEVGGIPVYISGYDGNGYHYMTTT